jgi:prevent-host-death family protein
MADETYVAAADFKARCLALLDDVDRDGRELVVTKRGRPVARVVPMQAPASLLASVRQLISDEELIAPVDEDWDAER